MEENKKTWCELDNHQDYALFEDFNAVIDQGEAHSFSGLLKNLSDVGLSHTSKAFYAGDKEAYEQALRAFRIERRHEVLSREFMIETFGEELGIHWYERNETRIEQLIGRFNEEMVVPFVGAGISVGGGFPSWKDHLRQQGRTAGIEQGQVEAWLSNGEYEQVIEHIENIYGQDVFAQEIRDVFSKTGSIQDLTLRISELFNDTLITTNYDRLLEQVFDTGETDSVQVINGMTAMEKPQADKVTIIKLHGDIHHPQRCILGKAQYDQAYGELELDIGRPIPKLLQYYFKNSSLLFLGCSLHKDRTIQVFKKVKELSGDFLFPQHFALEQAPETSDGLIQRNAELASLGITAIWYPKGQHEKLESILNHVKNELNYQKANIGSIR